MTADVEGTAEEVSADLVPHDPHVGTLFRTDDPVKVVEEATRVANALKPILVQQGMLQRIGPKDHVRVEGWVTLGAMLGVVPVVVWTHRVTDPPGWEAKVEARTLDGRVIGAAEAQCDRDENRWKTADEYAIRSMAQTRATSKALGGPLRFIVTLAGFEGTPAEEMPSEGARPLQHGNISEAQEKLVTRLVKKNKISRDELRVLLDHSDADGIAISEGWVGRLKKHQASLLIDRIQSGPIPDVEHPSDLPEDAPEHPLVDDDGQELFSPEAPS